MDLLAQFDPPADPVARPDGRASIPERQEAADVLRLALKRASSDALYNATFFSGYVLTPGELKELASTMLRFLEG